MCIIRALMDAGKCNVWGPGKSPGSRGERGVPLDPKPGAGDGAAAEPWWVPKGSFQAGCMEGHLQQRGQHKQSQGGRRVLVGKEKDQGFVDLGCVARSSAEEAP